MTSPSPQPSATSASYEITWQSVNAGGGHAGGGHAGGTSYQVDGSAGQSTIGYATSDNYEAGVGYWYGTQSGGGCSCPYQCDYDQDGFLTALDLGALIDVLFAGRPEEQDPGCPATRGDFNYDGQPDALDLSGLVDHLFSGGDPQCDLCDPVQSTCAP